MDLAHHLAALDANLSSLPDYSYRPDCQHKTALNSTRSAVALIIVSFNHHFYNLYRYSMADDQDCFHSIIQAQKLPSRDDLRHVLPPIYFCPSH